MAEKAYALYGRRMTQITIEDVIQTTSTNTYCRLSVSQFFWTDRFLGTALYVVALINYEFFQTNELLLINPICIVLLFVIEFFEIIIYVCIWLLTNICQWHVEKIPVISIDKTTWRQLVKKGIICHLIVI